MRIAFSEVSTNTEVPTHFTERKGGAGGGGRGGDERERDYSNRKEMEGFTSVGPSLNGDFFLSLKKKNIYKKKRNKKRKKKLGRRSLSLIHI